MPMAGERLGVLVTTLQSRPGHERVRALLNELCVVGLDIPEREIDFEIPIPEVRGRIDALFGATVFEVKRDLRREQDDAEAQLVRYIAEQERVARRRVLGVATDGATFVAYELVEGRLVRLDEHITNGDDPRALLRWLDTAITIRADLPPDPRTIREEFGRDGLIFRHCMDRLRELWAEASRIPEATLKHELWSRHLEFVYGTLIEPEELFLQHTYLTIVAKTMAVRVLVHGPVPPAELLEGTPFTQAGLKGAVETDFFDWVLLIPAGAELVTRIANQVGRFRLAEIEVDVLKGLYESLIDPRQRHYLGEYYTPDWLASWMCRDSIPEPLTTRVLDPACGSGTFLFHAIRRYLAAAESAGVELQTALEGCTEQVVGLDVHPVAVLFARVTYLLAIGPERLRRRTDDIYIPVYLGDALQWDVRPLLNEEEIEIAVPGEPPLRFPGSVAGDPALLEAVLNRMRELGDRNAPTRSFQSWMNTRSLPDVDRRILTESYERMRALHQSGRDHIWTYVVRNLTRPLWLSLRRGKPNVLIGNPPWLRFNAMSEALQRRFREASRSRGLWVGGRVATHQDLSAYFFVRCAERYLERDGRIAFVMPLACLSRAQYDGFRNGRYADLGGNVVAIIRFDGVWTFDSNVAPLFPVPSAVIFGHRDAVAAPLPRSVTAYAGQLPRRDATPAEAAAALGREERPWPQIVNETLGSVYRKRFRQGATVVPRRLFLVVPAEAGRFGVSRNAPLVTSRVGAQDKRPWKHLPPLRGQIENRFLRPLYLGESIAPFRVLGPSTAILPWDERRATVLDADSALERGYVHLAEWLRRAERLWQEHGPDNLTLSQQLDYYGKLTSQFPITPIRVVYAKAGILPAAAIIRDDQGVIDHKLYWMAASTLPEARYLAAILNSEAARSRVEALQSEGQFGPRDFDKVMLSLPIPRFRRDDVLHQALATAAAEAERVAGAAVLSEASSFIAARGIVRQALKSSRVAAKIDALVTRLLKA